MQRFDAHLRSPGRRQLIAGLGIVKLLACALGVLTALISSPLRAQTGGGYDLTRSTIDGGGATFSSAGTVQLGGTIGQPDAGALSGGGYSLTGGFWGAVVSEATAIPTSTASPTAMGTPLPTATPSATPIVTTSATPLSPATHTPTAMRSPATATATPAPCVGDCNNNRIVTVDELLTMVNIALGKGAIGDCAVGAGHNDGAITVDEIVAAVMNSLNGCP